MGHYAAEMKLDVQPDPEKPNRNYIVAAGFQVTTVAEFDSDPANLSRQTEYGPIPVSPALLRMGMQQFKSRADAEKHAAEVCDARIEELEKQLKHLKALKKQAPWKK